MASVDQMFQMMWDDYAAMNPQAGVIHRALGERGEYVINDHVAFRTFDLPGVGIEVLSKHFLNQGYEVCGQPYEFKVKKLHAVHLQHADPDLPKVFISALKVREFSKKLQDVVMSLIDQVPGQWFEKPESLVAGIPWKPVTYQNYQALLAESEYAAWMAAFGFRVNHFTVLFNRLKSFKQLSELNDFVKALGFALNSAGGEIKGTPELLLEQSSTLAHQVKVAFADQEILIPGCYYEFARRYAASDGKLFQGFVTQSADKIFESTNRRDQ